MPFSFKVFYASVGPLPPHAPFIVGHSWSAMLALAYECSHPEKRGIDGLPAAIPCRPLPSARCPVRTPPISRGGMGWDRVFG
jgi:pimeloyl-ACP methyl ester carboxylesterase